jgi:hypothetical protein
MLARAEVAAGCTAAAVTVQSKQTVGLLSQLAHDAVVLVGQQNEHLARQALQEGPGEKMVVLGRLEAL